MGANRTLAEELKILALRLLTRFFWFAVRLILVPVFVVAIVVVFVVLGKVEKLGLLSDATCKFSK